MTAKVPVGLAGGGCWARDRLVLKGWIAALLLVIAWGGWSGSATAQETGGRVISANDALRLAKQGQLIMIDVRSPQEWQQTGVPAGARLVTIHQPDGLIGFLRALDKVLGADRDRPVAVICARGNRSTLASAALTQVGYTQVYNIREGMFGSPDGPGWLARGLPTKPCSC